jgi:hypothetical protein
VTAGFSITMNAPTFTPDQLSQSAHRLEALVRRTAAFVAQQLGQLDDIGLQIAAEARASATLDAEPNRDDAARIQQVADDEQRIEEQLDHLAKAWKELESEQRRLMMLERGTSGQTPVTAAWIDEPAADRQFETPAAVQEHVVRHRSRDLIDESAPQDAAAAALQFQKLKREIRQQARRQR